MGFGGVCDQRGPMILLNFKYLNKQVVLILNVFSKNVIGFSMKRYEHLNLKTQKFKTSSIAKTGIY